MRLLQSEFYGITGDKKAVSKGEKKKMEMKEILNHMQANIYITDVENNEILFMNQKNEKRTMDFRIRKE